MNERDTERFWSHVEIGADDECWPWAAARDGPGYGRFSIGGRAGGMRTASRLAYEAVFGPLGRQHVRHTCDNRACCNPRHIIPGSHSDNMRDMAERERSRSTRLTASQVQEIRRRSGEPHRELADEFGVSTSNISMIVTGKTWKHLSLETFATLLEQGVRTANYHRPDDIQTIAESRTT